MTRDDYLKMSNPWAVIRAAAVSDTARDAAVSRIIDTMLQIQLESRHESVGYQPFSVTGNVPMPGAGKVVDQAMIAAERYHPASDWHKACGWMLDRLPKRQAAAMMMQAARVRPERMSDSVGGGSIWMVTAKQMLEQQRALLRSLGMLESVVVPFESVRAMQECAARARSRLRSWLKDEEIQQAA